VTTANEILVDALLDINALAPGQALPANNAAVALRKLNDLLDSLSTDKAFVYTTIENIFSWTPGTFKYTWGNPVGGTFGGTLIINTPTISGAAIPAGMVVGGTVTDLQGAVPPNTTILAFNTVAQTVTLSANALFTVAPAETFTYTTPGTIPLARPLRLNSGYTRINSAASNNLDFWFECTMSMERYNEFGLKFNPGPWPLVVAYQPTFPLATLWAYPNPSIAGEVHLFTDIILSEFANLVTNINLPQGYTRALKKLMSKELCPSWGKTCTKELSDQASEARAFLKRLNAAPIVTLKYDSEIVRSQSVDAGWIVTGGF
jgi:hypothetical protein